MKYLKHFEEASAYEAYKNGGDYITPNVSYIRTVNKVIFNSGTLLDELFRTYTLTTYTLPTFNIEDELLNTFKL